MSFELHLAPMEGVVDFILRDVLTGIGGIDQCLTEFIRVTDQLHSPAVIYRYAPELKMGSRTRHGTPMFLQYLGGQANPLAENAARGAELGALGIDLNFGCPAQTVNRHDGGASLLRTPDRLFQIVSTVRRAVPAHLPVTAKMRLGFDDPSQCIENALAVEAAGASWLTVHCRTKTDGYRPPAFWEWIPKIKEKVRLPIVANGEIWNVSDFWKCADVTGCSKIMIGRGGVAKPFLFRDIKASIQASESKNISQASDSLEMADTSRLHSMTTWTETSLMIPKFFEACTVDVSPHFAQARTKQWLKALALQNEEAKPLFEELKIFTNPHEFR
ncbi:MAG: tRNA-dihydrouridine synthase family protein, partial [Pseudobdellovibrionaceae bacterium]